MTAHAGAGPTRLGKHAAVERAYRELLAGWRKDFPAGHWRIGEGEALLGCCLVRLGRLAEAEPLLRAAHKTLVNAKGAPVHPGAVRGVELSLAVLYETQGNSARAARWRGPGK